MRSRPAAAVSGEEAAHLVLQEAGIGEDEVTRGLAASQSPDEVYARYAARRAPTEITRIEQCKGYFRLHESQDATVSGRVWILPNLFDRRGNVRNLSHRAVDAYVLETLNAGHSRLAVVLPGGAKSRLWSTVRDRNTKEGSRFNIKAARGIGSVPALKPPRSMSLDFEYPLRRVGISAPPVDRLVDPPVDPPRVHGPVSLEKKLQDMVDSNDADQIIAAAAAGTLSHLTSIERGSAWWILEDRPGDGAPATFNILLDSVDDSGHLVHKLSHRAMNELRERVGELASSGDSARVGVRLPVVAEADWPISRAVSQLVEERPDIGVELVAASPAATGNLSIQ